MQILYDEDFVNALYDLYLKYWNDTDELESDNSKYAYVPYTDLLELEEICVRIEDLDK